MLNWPYWILPLLICSVDFLIPWVTWFHQLHWFPSLLISECFLLFLLCWSLTDVIQCWFLHDSFCSSFNQWLPPVLFFINFLLYWYIDFLFWWSLNWITLLIFHSIPSCVDLSFSPFFCCSLMISCSFNTSHLSSLISYWLPHLLKSYLYQTLLTP